MGHLAVVQSAIRRVFPARDGAQAAFEFVLMFPLFIGLLMLLFDFGILMYQYVSVSNAAREGARYAAVGCGGAGCTLADVREHAVQAGGGFVKAVPTPVCPTEPVTEEDPDMICVNWVDPATNTARGPFTAPVRGDAVVVIVRHRYGLHLLPVDFPVVACAAMRLEANEPLPSAGDGPISC